MDGLNIQPSSSKFQQHGKQVTTTLEMELQRAANEKLTTIHDYQINAVLETKKFFENQNRGRNISLIVAPTGSGKTGMVVLLPYVLQCKKVLVLSPSKVVTNQLGEAFGYHNESEINENWSGKKCFFEKSSLLTDKDKLIAIREPVKILTATKEVRNMDQLKLVIVNAQKFGGASSASLINGTQVVIDNVKLRFEPFDTIIVDEAHHYPCKTWKTIVDLFKDKKIVFLTATPFYMESSKPVNILGRTQVITYEIKKESIEGVTIRRLDFKEDDQSLNEAQKYWELNQSIKNILDDHDRIQPSVKHQAIVLLKKQQEVKHVASLLENATWVTSEKTTGENLKCFSEGQFRTVVVCGMLLEGYDNSKISLCVILRKTTSHIVFQQFVGRCMRISFSGDTVKGVVLTYKKYNQQIMWSQFNYPVVGDNDPEED